MNFLRDIFSFLFVVVLSPMITSCGEKKQPPAANISKAQLPIDTAVIHGKLRRYYAIYPGDTATKEAVGRSLLNELVKMGYNDKTCGLLMDIARAHADKGNFDSSRYYFELAKPYCDKPVFDKTLPAAFLTEFGAFYYSMRSDNVAANNSYYGALQYLKGKGLTDNELTINIYLYLFATQEKLGHPEQGLTYLKEAEKLAVKLNSQQALIAVRTNLGYYYSERKDFETARRYFELSLLNEREIWDPAWDPNILIAALVGKASVLRNLNEHASAVVLLERAIQIARDHNIIYSEVTAAIELGVTYNKMKRYRESVTLVTEALQSQEGFNWYKEEGYRVLMEAFEGLGNYEQALLYQRKLSSFNDSLSNKEKTTALNELELRYQTASKDKDIAAKGLVIERQKNKLNRTYTWVAVISGVATMAVLILVMLYKNAVHRHKVRELEIQTFQRQIEIDLLKSSMRGEEQERKRLSRELHDGIGSMISSVIMQLSMLKKQKAESTETERYDQVLNLLQDTANEIRRTAHNLMPDIIQKLTLEEAIKNYCAGIVQNSLIKLDVRFYGDSVGFSSHCKLVIYRIVQELVHNIIKHSEATHAIVQGVSNENNFTLTIEDDGVGFDSKSLHQGIGLKNVEARVRSLEGVFDLESSPGKGTMVYMEFDCANLTRE
jgi:signal transduction histidine kinase